MAIVDQLTLQHMKIFVSVYKHRSATLAANELGLSNAAISRGLGVVREVFNDELFKRTASGFVHTDKAREIAPLIEEMLELSRRMTGMAQNFDPKQSEASFEIRVYDEFNFPVQEVIERRILQKAPNMRFNVRTLAYDCANDLVNGKVDFAVVYEGFDDSRLHYECFARTKVIYLLCRKDHPLLSLKEMNMEEISKYKLVEIDNYRDLQCPLLVDICNQKGRSMQVSSYTESVASAFRLIASSDSVAIVCNQFTRQFADMVDGLDYVTLPEAILGKIVQMRSEIRPIGNYVIYGGNHQSPAFHWVKNELISGLRESWTSLFEAAEAKEG